METKLEEYVKYKESTLYRPSRDEQYNLFGKIDVYSSEKKFASAKCCMCCR